MPRGHTEYVPGHGLPPSAGLLTCSFSRRAMIRKVVAIFICFAASLITTQAQSNFAVVRGSILDPQHRPIAGAHIHLTASETGAKREVISNRTGLYEIAGLQPGAYSLAVDSPGFNQATQSLVLEVGEQATLDLQ